MSDPFIAAVSEALPQDLRVYEINKVPAKPTYPYVVWSIADDRPTGYRLDARHGLRFYRFTWQSFGKSLASARAVDRAVTDAVLDETFDVEGYDCAPCYAGVDSIFGTPIRDADDQGVIGLTSSLTFTATKE